LVCCATSPHRESVSSPRQRLGVLRIAVYGGISSKKARGRRIRQRRVGIRGLKGYETAFSWTSHRRGTTRNGHHGIGRPCRRRWFCRGVIWRISRRNDHRRNDGTTLLLRPASSARLLRPRPSRVLLDAWPALLGRLSRRLDVFAGQGLRLVTRHRTVRARRSPSSVRAYVWRSTPRASLSGHQPLS
jgi:hypothetical protein